MTLLGFGAARWPLRCLVVLALGGQALAANATTSDDAPFARKVTVNAKAMSAELLDIVTTEDVEIKAQAAIQGFGQIALPVNEHYADLEVLEAATLKADGTRIDVAPDQILTSAAPNAPILGIFQADAHTVSLVFSDVAVGDTVHYKIKVHQKARGIAGGFALSQVSPASARTASLEVSLDLPDDLKINKTVNGFNETSKVVDGRKQIKWVLQPQPYHPDVQGATAAIDRDPFLLVSSYPSEELIGRNFFEKAAPASEPTPDVKAIAEDITKGLADKKEQARAIYEFVSKKVRYMAIFLGAGGFVPHPAATVLTAKYGDCKDHATLMRALLAAKGIASDYVMISLGPAYKAIATPAPEKYNHVILYLPDFDLYADPTNAHSSFGVIEGLYDKPVLRVGAKGVVVARTPPLTADGYKVVVKADVSLLANGTATGTSTTSTTGAAATALRTAMVQASLKGGAEFMRLYLASQRLGGTGNLDLRDPTDHAEPYEVSGSFALANRYFGPGSNTNPNGVPYGPNLLSPIYFREIRFLSEKETTDFVCAPGTYQQIIDLHLYKQKPLAKVPPDKSVTAAYASFTATYKMLGGTLHIERKFVSSVKSSVCTLGTVILMRPALIAAWLDLNTRLQFAGEAEATSR